MTTKTIHEANLPTLDVGVTRSGVNWDLFTSLAGFWEDAVVDNIDEEYDRLVQHLRDSAKSAEGLRVAKRRLSYETLELIRQRGAARAAGNYQLTSELARRYTEAIEEDLKQTSTSVGRSRRGGEKLSQRPSRLRPSQD
ncbi:hypothetical protein ANCCAN_25598 [Ancylostoma caninum]|uniref:Uncharacterized protein n=1 Tax=Ancylostoma caninum TaxID=29170 RepID=A0A368FCV2_ANCCA|nr:hypothetical protein ANCCAN_25598 [Ancylostoma caninum]